MKLMEIIFCEVGLKLTDGTQGLTAICYIIVDSDTIETPVLRRRTVAGSISEIDINH